LAGILDFREYCNDITNLVTANGYHLFKYLPEITELYFDNCTALTREYNNIN